ncbi:MAG: DUF1801 domain-containing protein, partial [Gemmatimonadales bacterium]|nr:DUF1801 domain-containing protein [Gemmatimonadales bacterium]
GTGKGFTVKHKGWTALPWVAATGGAPSSRVWCGRPQGAKAATLREGVMSDKPATVAALFQALDHPLKGALRAACAAIRAADPSIVEGIKWNAPSYRVGEGEFFATANIHARGKQGETVLIILHRGAKARGGKVSVADPDGLIEWLGADRGAIRFADAAAVRRGTSSLQAIVREWIQQV